MKDETGHERRRPRVDAAQEWGSPSTRWAAGLLAFAAASGLAIYLLPFMRSVQLLLLAHVAIGLLLLVPVARYSWRHWQKRSGGNFSHYQLLGYTTLAAVFLASLSGLVLMVQGLWATRMSLGWDFTHLFTGIVASALLLVHIVSVWRRPVPPRAAGELQPARRRFLIHGGLIVFLATILPMGSALVLLDGEAVAEARQAFPESYNWRFGADRPFAPSLARVDDGGWEARLMQDVEDLLDEAERRDFRRTLEDRTDRLMGPFERIRTGLSTVRLESDRQQAMDQLFQDAVAEMRQQGAVPPERMAGSQSCGSAGCHQEIYDEWAPSAHRYSSMDDMFQVVQTLMVEETSPEHTRYCAGCHDPISLFSGAKNADNMTLSVEGADEGISCVGCHSIVQTDVQGNGDYTLDPPESYLYEQSEGLGKTVSDFLIRTYPDHHIESYSRPLYKTAEFCGACHKQYVDREVNTDIGKVQGQNQYDSWKNSRWYHEDDPAQTIQCRECHMPLVADSRDPARGDETDPYRHRDDGMHRSHRTLGGNQYIPLVHDLPGAQEHVRLTEQWLRGEYPVPEIADRWTDGPVVRMDLVVPEAVRMGEDIQIQVRLANNKTGHDFPTGPLDMIESWVELRVEDADGRLVYHAGGLDEAGLVVGTPAWFKADGYDREGALIDRHNLWDLVGASYKRALYPGMNDSVMLRFQCPSMARGRLRDPADRERPGRRSEDFQLEMLDKATMEPIRGPLSVEATLWYRKANPEFLDRVYGADAGVRSPLTAITEARAEIAVLQAPLSGGATVGEGLE